MKYLITLPTDKDESTTNFWSPLSFKILAKVANINLQYYNCSTILQLPTLFITLTMAEEL